MRKLASAASAAVLAAALTPAAQAARLDLSLSDEHAQVFVHAPTDSFGGNAEAGGGLMFTENDDIVGLLRLLSMNRVSPSLQLGVGVQGYVAYVDATDDTAGAVAVGGNVGFGLASQVPLMLVLEGWIAPDILSFGDIEGLTDLSLRLEASISNNAGVFVGWRQLEVEGDGGGDVEVIDGVNFGVRLGF